MSGKEQMAADLRGPFGGTDATADSRGTQITAVATSGSAQSFDLSSATYFGGTRYQGDFVRIISNQTLFYFWSEQASETVDETATAATNRARQCDMLPANTPREEIPAGRYFHAKTAAAGTVRISITNSVTRN
ncbi:MAG: hypothetical protein FJ027_24305 [Candidatus Rokubacteria bacterium]|nr:hypothetical protein [Candidatus Rokubacteria bacterium]